MTNGTKTPWRAGFLRRVIVFWFPFFRLRKLKTTTTTTSYLGCCCAPRLLLPLLWSNIGLLLFLWRRRRDGLKVDAILRNPFIQTLVEVCIMNIIPALPGLHHLMCEDFSTVCKRSDRHSGGRTYAIRPNSSGPEQGILLHDQPQLSVRWTF